MLSFINDHFLFLHCKKDQYQLLNMLQISCWQFPENKCLVVAVFGGCTPGEEIICKCWFYLLIHFRLLENGKPFCLIRVEGADIFSWCQNVVFSNFLNMVVPSSNFFLCLKNSYYHPKCSCEAQFSVDAFFFLTIRMCPTNQIYFNYHMPYRTIPYHAKSYC